MNLRPDPSARQTACMGHDWFQSVWLAGLLLAGCAAPRPEAGGWARLAPYQGALTADEWRLTLERRFVPNGTGAGFLEVAPDGNALVLGPMDDKPVQFATLRYLPTRPPDAPRPALPPGTRFWRSLAELGPATPDHPLAGVHLALDPGHLGGAWGKMEARSFSFNGDPAVQEGDLALRVAQLLKPRLEALGAQVSLVRDRPGPVTNDTPASLRSAAEKEWLASARPPIPPPGSPAREDAITHLAELLFYRTREIEARAQRVNQVLKPDLVLCLHLDAAAWTDPQNPALLEQPQHFHILVNGAYSAAEVREEAQRIALVERIASGAGDEELAVALAMAEGAVPVFGQPASGYSLPTGVALGGNGYVWGRNVLADRLYRCPVVFLEPYVANSVEGYARIQAGEYPGTREFNGVARKNVFVEYGDAVVAGLVKYYGQRSVAR